MKPNFNLARWGEKIESKNFDDFLEKIHLNGVHEIQKDINPYHILTKNISLNNNYILIGFHGMVQRTNVTPPTFYFSGVAEKSKIGLISIADPSLNLSENLKLSWYLGNKINQNVTQEIAMMLDSLIAKTGKKLILTGGSGGGFAALNVHTHMKLSDKAVVFAWNPQTDITKYNLSAIKDYFNICVVNKDDVGIGFIRNQLIKKKIPFEVECRNDLKQLIFINGYDQAHVRKHVRRFINNANKDKESRVFIGDWGYGHIEPNRELIIEVISSLSNNKSLDDIVESMPEYSKKVLNFNDNKHILDNIITCHTTLIDLTTSKILSIKTNIYDYFMGFQVYFQIKDSSNNLLFKSNYLLGADVCELYWNISNGDIKKLKGVTIEVCIEDIKGDLEVYSFEFEEIQTKRKCLNMKL